MKYALLVYTKPGSHEALSPEEYGPVNAEYMGLRDDPRCIGGAHLQPIDTKEVFGGYYVLDAANLDEALEWAQRIPAIRLGGAVEIRPLVELAIEDAF